MLEVNNFNAIRISIASPDQIRSWSYGEVTKPETINYRTLKPEKDGLFCERIFGPTKDWECYCGKYKRVRYRGIVCDKCGVEVARSKVRRERMGHINLASPVSHIWYFKGTPSRLGLLLDISPRNLEKILYFAQYIVTHLDENNRARALRECDQELAEAEAKAQRGEDERLRDIREEAEAKIREIEGERDRRIQPLEEHLATTLNNIMERASRMGETLREQLGEVAESDIMWEGNPPEVIVPAGEVVSAAHVESLRTFVERRVAETEQQIRGQQDEYRSQAAQQITQVREEALRREQNLGRHDESDLEQERARIAEKKKEIESLRRGELLSEGRYRELVEKCGTFFKAGMGAEAIRDIIAQIDLGKLAMDLRGEIRNTSGQRRKKATKRLRVVEAFRKSGASPQWMILEVLPVIPPDLRPMVQLDGGRFATSDLNDLYRRVINRNNRLKRLLELGAPEIIIRNEKRMLQEAVDALIDNGRRGRAVAGSGNHKLKSLSDMLKGKQGRFRQNLLGKRVDYSGRSVIVVGPELKLHQCGLPKRMALELFKPFVMRQLVERQYAPNIKSAKRIVERVRNEVWEVLEKVIQDHPVLLNRAPTLHRLGIQAFEAVLVEGSAIQIHPLVCAAFNADFDGDQMAVHVPLSKAAQEEARQLMLSTRNLLLPADGEPVITPTKDMVFGCYYLTAEKPNALGQDRIFGSMEEVRLAYDLGQVDLQARIRVRVTPEEVATLPPEVDERGRIITTVGRVIFNQVLPPAIRFRNYQIDKGSLKRVIGDCYRTCGPEATADVGDRIKDLGFYYATRSGATIAIDDIVIPEEKQRILAEADARVGELEDFFQQGLISSEERYRQTVDTWTQANEKVTSAVSSSLDVLGSLYMMAKSGAAKGEFNQIRQLAGMRGLMSDPSGRIIDLPIRANFREGLSVLEYFISTHGARKGLADTALRTAESGYLTRRLIDVAQDVIIKEEDCGDTNGITIGEMSARGISEQLDERLRGRITIEPIIDPETREVLVEAGEEISDTAARRIMDAGIRTAQVRSPLSCQARHGLCRLCYGRDLARGGLVRMGEAVGIIAAQSIGEPGTQLTMRTFHTGGVAGEDITQGLPRVEELFEARQPKESALIAEISGKVELIRDGDAQRIKVVSTDVIRDEYEIPEGYTLNVQNGSLVETGAVIAVPQIEGTAGEERQAALRLHDVTARMAGRVVVQDGALLVEAIERDEREYPVPAGTRVRVEHGQEVRAGEQLTDGAVNPQQILAILGRERVQHHLVEEVQKVYRGQGVVINDKHIEVIVRQMLRKVTVDNPGDTELLPGELIDRFEFEDANIRVLSEGGEPATAKPVLLGVTKASLNTASFLAAASFQETTRVLTEAAIEGKKDRLVGLKENVIIGKLIPAGSGLLARQQAPILTGQELIEGEGFEVEYGSPDEDDLRGLMSVGPIGEAFPTAEEMHGSHFEAPEDAVDTLES